MLEDAGFQSRGASCVVEAVVLLEEYHDEVTLLFTYVQMQGDRDGFALARLAVVATAGLLVMIVAAKSSGKCRANSTLVVPP
jgi:hypothetical protein